MCCLSRYFVALYQHRQILSNPDKLEREARFGYPTIGHLTFLAKSYKPGFYFFEVLECVRRLLLGAVVGIVAEDSAAAPVLGLLIAQAFVAVFNKEPFKTAADSRLGQVLAYSLVLFFMAALMVKVDATGDDANDQRVLGALLLVVLSLGPVAVVVELVLSYIRLLQRSIIQAVASAPHSNGGADASEEEETSTVKYLELAILPLDRPENSAPSTSTKVML
jgi:hypothetical protein